MKHGIALTRDGGEIHFQTHGNSTKPAIFMGPHFYASRPVEEPPHTRVWIEDLKHDFFLITADYPRGVGKTGAPLGLAFTPQIAVEECERIADAAGIDRFGWLGYSFGGAVGVQLACRTKRVAALAVGGFPPLNAPFRLLAEILTAAVESASAGTLKVDVSILRTSIEFYRGVSTWAESQEIAKLTIPRLAFMGDEDTAQGLPPPWSAPLAEILKAAEGTLRGLQWRIEWLRGHDHATATRPEVSLSLVHRFFLEALTR